jgi:alpha-galactosidase
MEGELGMGVKIAFIGAGSTMFARLLMCDVYSHPALRDARIVLEDIDEQRLEVTYRLARRIIETHNLPGQIERTTSQREALEDADFVISMIAVGGLDAWEIDKSIPMKYGVDQIVGDTLGPGGVCRALRHIPPILSIVKDMEELCPRAMFINYANPMAPIMWAVNRSSSIQSVGLCHSVQATTKEIAGYIGAAQWENYPVTDRDWHDFYYRPMPERVSFSVAGINHMAWYLTYEVDGKDAYPEIRKAYRNPKAYAADTVRFEILKHFGYFVTESPHHMSEYVPYFRKKPEDIKRYMSYTWNALEITRQKGKDDERSIQRQIEGDEPIELKPSVEYGAQIMNAVVTNEVTRINGNVHNGGLITNLPEDCCVEVPCLVDRNGIHPCYVGTLPPQLAALNRTNVNVQSLIVEAALKRDREAACRAVMLDPLTASLLSLDDIRNMVYEMFREEREWILHME